MLPLSYTRVTLPRLVHSLWLTTTTTPGANVGRIVPKNVHFLGSVRE
jgi:hypothetical protein